LAAASTIASRIRGYVPQRQTFAQPVDVGGGDLPARGPDLVDQGDRRHDLSGLAVATPRDVVL
jgi:hypothetical protein